MTRFLVTVGCIALLAGCGDKPVAKPPRLPNPCSDPQAFARAVKKLEHEPGVEVSANAKRAMRLLARNGAANCRTSGAYLDDIKPLTKK